VNLGDYGFLTDDPMMIPKLVLTLVAAAALHTSVLVGVSSLFKGPRLAGGLYAGVYFLTTFFSRIIGAVRLSLDDAPRGVQEFAELASYWSLDGLIKGASKAIFQSPGQALFGIGEDKIKKVGVIGATGGVGRLAVAYLLEKGASTRCAPSSSPPAEFVVRAFGSSIPVPRPAADVVVRARRPCSLSLPAGYSVRAIVRSKDRAKELLPAEIELKLGDTCDPAFGDGSLPLCLACYTCCTALWVHRLNPKPLMCIYQALPNL
jgi:hypothetical protein